VLRHIRFFVILLLPASLLACSSPQSQERLNTVLCWLRPSCLPSDLPSPTSEAPRAETPSTQINSVAAPKRSELISPQISSPEILDARYCVTSTQITVTASNPLVTVSYIEPTTKANGQALTNLAKTTIYQDLGKGLVKYKDIKATNPAGGGTIREKISFSLKPEETLHTTICVTATDTNGREG
jgi:hypothetical protein